MNIDRIEQDLYALAKIGYCEEDHGIYRQAFSKADLEARKWLTEQLIKLDMQTYMDGAGNIIGRYGDPDRQAILIGSHLDTVPRGGMFDGALGVIAGLECIRIIQENNIPLNNPIEVIGTSEEEGRFGGMLGAMAITGGLTPDWVQHAHDPAGESLLDAMNACGLNERNLLHSRREPESMLAYLELHIEQGPILEAEGKSIGVVEGISGVFTWLVRLIGKADHAGTAPMDMRSDAFTGVADFAHEIQRIIEEDGTDKSRLTIGRLELKPGFPHTIPGEVEFTLVGRDMSQEVMLNLASSCRKVLSAIARRHRLMFEYEELSWLEPAICSPEVMQRIEAKTNELGYDYILMPSGAGHDAQFFTKVVPTGMIFIPSVGGISHAPDEWSHWQDVEKGCNVLLHTVLEIMQNGLQA